MDISERSERAAKVARQYRGEVNGKAIELKPAAVMESMFSDYNDMTEEYLLADVMSRPGLSMRERSLIIIVTLTAIRLEEGIKKGHMQWALNVGLTREEVAEAIMNTCRYSGWPNGEDVYRFIDEAYPEIQNGKTVYELEKAWTTPGLTEREQKIITIAAYVALRFRERLGVLIDQVLDKDLSRDEILEIIIQVTPFSGWPVGVEALRIANEVFTSGE